MRSPQPVASASRWAGDSAPSVMFDTSTRRGIRRLEARTVSATLARSLAGDAAGSGDSDGARGSRSRSDEVPVGTRLAEVDQGFARLGGDHQMSPATCGEDRHDVAPASNAASNEPAARGSRGDAAAPNISSRRLGEPNRNLAEGLHPTLRFRSVRVRHFAPPKCPVAHRSIKSSVMGAAACRKITDAPTNQSPHPSR